MKSKNIQKFVAKSNSSIASCPGSKNNEKKMLLTKKTWRVFNNSADEDLHISCIKKKTIYMSPR